MVLGGKEGVFYIAHGGMIDRAGETLVESPRYSDNEGFFRSRSKRGASVSGSVQAPDKAGIQKKFIKACMKEVRRIEKEIGFNEIYLFVPARLKNLVTDAMPARLGKMIIKTKTGNYHEEHPFEILKLLFVKP